MYNVHPCCAAITKQLCMLDIWLFAAIPAVWLRSLSRSPEGNNTLGNPLLPPPQELLSIFLILTFAVYWSSSTLSSLALGRWQCNSPSTTSAVLYCSMRCVETHWLEDLEEFPSVPLSVFSNVTLKQTQLTIRSFLYTEMSQQNQDSVKEIRSGRNRKNTANPESTEKIH